MTKVKRFHYESYEQLGAHLADFMAAYNFARCLKTLSGLAPYEYTTKNLNARAGEVRRRSDSLDAAAKKMGVRSEKTT